MVRGEVTRLRKYYGKVLADPVRARIDALKDMMVEQEEARLTELTALEGDVRTVLERRGVTTIQYPIYYAYGRRLWKLKTKFTGAIVAREARILYEEFKFKGLVPAVLEEIASVLGVPILGI